VVDAWHRDGDVSRVDLYMDGKFVDSKTGEMLYQNFITPDDFAQFRAKMMESIARKTK